MVYPLYAQFNSISPPPLRSAQLQAGIQEGEQKTQNTIKEIESNGLTVDAEDAEPAEEKKEEKV